MYNDEHNVFESFINNTVLESGHSGAVRRYKNQVMPPSLLIEELSFTSSMLGSETWFQIFIGFWITLNWAYGFLTNHTR